MQSTPDNSNLEGKSRKVRVIGSSSNQELEANNRLQGNEMTKESCSIHFRGRKT